MTVPYRMQTETGARPSGGHGWGARLALSLMTLLSAASAIRAAEPMSASEFERYTTGKTLTYGEYGQPYGVERYLPGRRVVWAFVNDDCRYGTWYEEAGRICFVYEYDPDPQCWTFQLTSGGLRAQYMGDPSASALIEVEEDPDALKCPGPDVGA